MQEDDPTKRLFNLGTVIDNRPFVINIDRKTRHVIVYTTNENKEQVPVGNGTWDVDSQDVSGGYVDDNIMTEDVCDGIIQAIRQSTWSTLQYEELNDG